MRKVENFYLILHPRPAYVIGSGAVGEKVNFMAASWVSPIAEEPPLVGVAIDVTSYTHELLESYGEFTVNILPVDRVEDIYFYGSRSGRDVDKSQRLSYRRGVKVRAPVLEASIGVLECRVFEKVRAKDVTFFIGEVLHAEADENFFDEKRGWNLRKVNLPLHNWGRGFYDVGKFYLAGPE